MNKPEINLARIIGFAGLLLGGAATLIGRWSDEQQMKQTVAEEVEKALAQREEEES